MSRAKNFDRFPVVDVYRAAREEGVVPQKPQVAVTLSPKLSRDECVLYPVEGIWDLFFCFLEAETSVSLGVSVILPVLRYVLTIRAGHL